MPLPLLLGGAAVFATVVGASSHKDAHETNEKAESLVRKARGLYDDSKESLEAAQKDTEKLLLKLGNEKKKVLAGSMKKFVESYDRIKNIQLKESGGLTELSRFSIEQKDVVQIRQLSDIYTTSVQSGAAGAATGAVIALAASGTLPVVTSALSMAGTCLTWGSVGAAASIAGSAISTAVAATPLAAIVAPAVFFTGISASMKADENLEKAKTMYAEAERASEEMKVSETLCKAIGKRSEMFYELLLKLDGMFGECTDMLAKMIKKKERHRHGGKKEITVKDLTEKEIALVAVTRALAGAVKSVIDTPILSDDGKVTKESLDIYNNSMKYLPDFSKQVYEIKGESTVRSQVAPDKNKTGNQQAKRTCINTTKNKVGQGKTDKRKDKLITVDQVRENLNRACCDLKIKSWEDKERLHCLILAMLLAVKAVDNSIIDRFIIRTQNTELVQHLTAWIASSRQNRVSEKFVGSLNRDELLKMKDILEWEAKYINEHLVMGSRIEEKVNATISLLEI